MIKFLFPFIYLLIFFSVSGQETEPRLIGLDNDIEDLIKVYNAVGLSVVIVENDKIIYSKGFGYRDFEKKLKVNVNTLLPIGSSTKSFSSALLGIMESEGLISLKEKPSFYIPKLQFYNDKMNNLITVEDLLCHKSGIGNLDGTVVFFPSNSNEEFISKFKFLKPNAEIKNSFFYSNTGYGLAGQIIENVTNKSWEYNLNEKLLKPLKMYHTTSSINNMLNSSNYSVGYGKHGKVQKKVPYFEFGHIKPGGAIISSANDMGNWLIAWLNKGKFKGKQVIPENFINEALSLKNILPQKGASSKNFLFGYGYGWFLQSLKGHYLAQHGGNTSGFSTQMAIYPYEKIGIAVLTNQHSSALAYNIEDIISNRMLNLPKKALKDYKVQVSEIYVQPETTTKASIKKASNYIGTYTHKGYGSITIKENAGHLYAEFPEYIFRLVPQNEYAFVMEATSENSQYFNPNFQLNFMLDVESNIDTFKINLQSESVIFKKIKL